MSLPKPSSSAAPATDILKEQSDAVVFGQKLKRLGVDACKFAEVKTVSVGYTEKKGEKPLTNEELLQSLIQLAPDKEPADVVDTLYNGLVDKGQIKQGKCSSGR